jgi:hypothetical protein
MKLIVVCNNVPDTVQAMLTELGHTKVTHLPTCERASESPKNEITFVFSFPDFKLSLKLFNSEAYAKKTVVLFCPIVQAKSLEGALFLDVSKNKKGIDTIKSTYKNLSVDVLSAYLAKPYKSKKVKEKDKEFKYCLIDTVRSGSLLNPLMTLLYTVKAEGGVKIKHIVLKWLVSKDKISALEKQLNDTYDFCTVSKKFCAKLIELLSSDLGKNYKLALSKIELKKGTEDAENITQIAKKHETDDYELRYIINVMCKAKKHLLNGRDIASLYNKDFKTLKK